MWELTWKPLDILRAGQDGQHFADNIFKSIFLDDDYDVLIQISLKFILNGPIDKQSSMS